MKKRIPELRRYAASGKVWDPPEPAMEAAARRTAETLRITELILG